MIVVTGGELLSGIYPDGHTYFITRTLRPLGLHCVGSMSVDDQQADIEAALKFSLTRVRLVIVTGGLGPTDNDITRETLSGFTGIALREDPEALRRMEQRFNTPRDKLRANLRRQTQVPSRGGYLKNSAGTAVGLVFETDEAVIVALPGPPREVKPMVVDELVPYLSRQFGTRLPGSSLTLRFVGLGQSQVDETLERHVPLPPDVTLTSQFEGGRVDFTFTLPDETPENRARLQEIKQLIVQRLGDFVYGEDDTTLEAHVADLLEQRHARLAFAEAGSGGALAAALSDADQSGRALSGAFVAANEERLGTLLGIPETKWASTNAGADRLDLLARAAADRTGAQAAVVVGDVRQDADQRRTVQVLLKLPHSKAVVHRIPLRGTGEIDRVRLTTRVFDLLRRELK